MKKLATITLVFCTLALITFSTNKNICQKNHEFIEMYNIEALKASAFVGKTVTCDATNTNSCTITTTSNGTGYGTGNSVITNN